ncbi:beta/gamma crystallin-related protein [Terricaulis sp.]|uniref:beta/gamma crystallin-related protein n=1 Tax=Terricaulis sp. TaxID=2768686 RepID=UPI002AC64047|nr:beta/gamma crystallin-related protein [Terricaulis sp.]MDZ4690273.1 beta/gamma crystallin-related protein [Terricaulis sp.]
MKHFILAAALVLGLTGAAAAQSADGEAAPCVITTTTSIGPNGETITEREGCGAVEMRITGGTPAPVPPTTSSNVTREARTSTVTDGQANTRTRTDTRTQTTVQTDPNSSQTEIRTRSTSTSVTTPDMGDIGSMLPPVRASGAGWNVAIGGAADGDDDFDALAPPPDFARIVLYDRADFRGRTIGVTRDTPNLAQRRFSGLASAVRVQAGVWEICTAANYAGSCAVVDADIDLEAAGLGDAIVSLRRVR